VYNEKSPESANIFNSFGLISSRPDAFPGLCADFSKHKKKCLLKPGECRKAIETEAALYVAKHYSEGNCSVYLSGEDIYLVIEASKFNPTNFWLVIYVYSLKLKKELK
jgi:hypothetical protein